MGSIYKNLRLGDELLDNTLKAYGVLRNPKHDYIVKDSPSGLRISEYDEESNFIDSWASNVNEVNNFDYTEEKKSIVNIHNQTTKVKNLTNTIVLVLIVLFILSVIVILIGKEVI